jgi:hypothetical protein
MVKHGATTNNISSYNQKRNNFCFIAYIYPMKIFNLVFVLRLIGGIELIMALSSIMSNYNFSKNSTIVKGVVVGFTEDTFSEGGVLYAPIIKFNANDDKVYEVKSNYYNNFGIIQQGDSLSVAYKNNNPEEAQYLEGDSFYSSAVNHIIYGLLFIALSFFAVRFRTWRRQTTSQIKEHAETLFLTIDATIIRVGTHTKDEKKLYFIEATYTKNDTTKTYVSKYFEQDPTPYLNDIKTVTIKGKFLSNNYTMDTSFLPFD